MTSPKLSVNASGYGGRGYFDIFGVNGGRNVMSITTAISSLDKPGIRVWERRQVAAFAVAHAEEILAKDEEVAYRYLMAVPKFLTPEKHDQLDPEMDVWNAPEFVLNDLAETGTWIHEYLEQHLLGNFTPPIYRDDHYQMVEAFHAWEAEHDIEVLSTERTVYGDRYAGTADLFAKIDGVTTLMDFKTSKKVYESHKAQIAAIGAAITTAQEVPEGTEGAVKHKLQPSVAKEYGGQEFAWYVEEPLPDFQQYAVLQVRPGDFDARGTFVDGFCEMHVIPPEQVNVAYELFTAARDARLAAKKLSSLEKEG